MSFLTTPQERERQDEINNAKGKYRAILLMILSDITAYFENPELANSAADQVELDKKAIFERFKKRW